MSIVAGYIPTAEGLAAVEFAIAEAKRTQRPLVVVNTGHHGNYADPSFASPQDLDALDAQLTEAGIEHDIRQPVEGRSAAEEILGTAADVTADLIVIGLRRRTPVGKLLTGSTAQQILLDAECPVMAVKARSTT